MKKTLPLILLGILFISNPSKAQILKFLYADSVVNADTSTTVYQADFNLKNISGQQLNIKCKRTDKELANGHDTYFCFGGTCFGPKVSLSPTTVTLEPNQEYGEFYSDLDNEFKNTGTSKVYYTIYDINDSTNKHFDFTVTYIVDATVGINKKSFGRLVIFPNPATNTINIAHNNTNGNVSFELYNIIGNRVASATGSGNNTSVNTENLNNGYYFLKTMVNNEIVDTQKIIIQK